MPTQVGTASELLTQHWRLMLAAVALLLASLLAVLL